MEGKSADGIELVSLDFEKHEAFIRKGTREAVIHLESKRIVERRHGPEAAALLRRLFNLTPGTPEHAKYEKLLDDMADLARRHPGGADGYADELIATYQGLLDAHLVAADSPDAPAHYPAPSDTGDPFLKMIVPSLGKMGRTFNNSATSEPMLQAAIHHRLTQLGRTPSAPAPADPWAESPNTGFTHEPTPDGGFVLRSRYETTTDQPLTYKFAAPDAGLVRPK